MRSIVRYVVGCLVFLGILVFGWYVLGIHPSLAELLLVVLATSISTGVEEGLRR